MPERNFSEQMARVAVEGYDDAQDVRTSMMNRIRDVVRKRNEDIPFDKTEEEKEKDDYDSKYNDDNLEDIIEQMKEEDKLSNEESNYLNKMIETAERAQNIENSFESLMAVVTSEPIYEDWIEDVYGVSNILASRLLHQFGYCQDFPKVSNLWSYCGFAPGQERKRGEQLSFNPEAKTLGWLVADGMVKQGSRSNYREEFYDPYKEEQELRFERDQEGLCIKCGEKEQTDHFIASQWHCEKCGQSGYGDETAKIHMEAMSSVGEEGHSPSFGTSEEVEVDLCDRCASSIIEQGERFPTAPNNQGHADNRARRYLAKKFLKHYWAIARTMKGYETPDEWILTHGGHEKSTDTFENPFYAYEEVVGHSL